MSTFEHKTQAEVFSWHDGDTFYGIVDLGFGQYIGTTRKPARVRCGIIDSPELSVDKKPNPAGLAALVYASGLVPAGLYPCYGYGLDNYGRPLVDLILPGGQFSYLMLSTGHARPYGK